jgi:hypothetical protein
MIGTVAVIEIGEKMTLYDPVRKAWLRTSEEEAEAREDAEARAEQEAEARREAEARAQALEAELARLRDELARRGN